MADWSERDPTSRPISKGRLRWFRGLLLSWTLLLLGGVWIGGELVYRSAAGIPVFGGELFFEDLVDESVVAGVVMGAKPPGAESKKIQDLFAKTMTLYRPSDNPILFYEPRPGANYEQYAINSHGFRDRDYSIEKRDSVFRIAVLGDSIIWGHGLALKDSFAKQLEHLLIQGLERPFEVLNFGVSGYSTQQEVELYRVRASLFSPDLVIVGFCLNDGVLNSTEGEAFRRTHYDIFHKSYLLDEIKHHTNLFLWKTFDRPYNQFTEDVDLRKEFALLTDHSDGRRNLVVIFPHLLDFEDYQHGRAHEEVKQALDGLNYEWVDLLGPYSRFAATDLVQDPGDRVHPMFDMQRIRNYTMSEYLLET